MGERQRRMQQQGMAKSSASHVAAAEVQTTPARRGVQGASRCEQPLPRLHQ
jgi:hypothetical protein